MNIKYINMIKKNKSSGFTLLELLIVIAILAILSVALVLVLNPAETLKKARDSQRMSDLSTIKTAIGLYMTTVSPAYIGGVSDNNLCKGIPGAVFGVAPTTSRISYSVLTASVSDATIEGSAVGDRAGILAANLTLTDGTGWIPVNFGSIAGGSPISALPIDPTNSVTAGTSTASVMHNSALVYRYACVAVPLTFEIDATLESDAFTGVVAGTEDKRITDGGNNTLLYEVGTTMNALGAATDF